uniref:Uncharacterized protein n=1 Tax=Rhizophora mucronata TaxID=61149 RepID=A0A2P2N0Z0_RHIMU
MHFSTDHGLSLNSIIRGLTKSRLGLLIRMPIISSIT